MNTKNSPLGPNESLTALPAQHQRLVFLPRKFIETDHVSYILSTSLAPPVIRSIKSIHSVVQRSLFCGCMYTVLLTYDQKQKWWVTGFRFGSYLTTSVFIKEPLVSFTATGDALFCSWEMNSFLRTQTKTCLFQLATQVRGLQSHFIANVHFT